MPTKKWVAAFVTYWIVFALTKLAIPVDPIVEQAINGVAALVAAYLVPNDLTPGGVPQTTNVEAVADSHVQNLEL